MRLTFAVLLFTLAAVAEDFVVFREPGSTPVQQLTRYLSSIAVKELDERA